MERGTAVTARDAESWGVLFRRVGLDGYPGIRRERVTTKDCKALMLGQPVPLFVNGVSYNIQNKRVGPGVYEVWLEEAHKSPAKAEGEGK
jgi:hypothetical protein